MNKEYSEAEVEVIMSDLEDPSYTGSCVREPESENILPEAFDVKVSQKLSLQDALQQIIVSCIAHCIVIQAGANMAYSTILVGGLQSSKEMILNKDEESWIASLVTITLPIGSLIVGPIMDKFGRKLVCCLTCLPSIISWILFASAHSVSVIYIARIVAGIGAGLTTVGLVFISEITHPQIRPMMLSLNSVFVSLGILITCCLGAWLTWKEVAICFLILNIIIFFILLTIPESPYWLLCFGNGRFSDKRVQQAEKILKRLNKSQLIYEQEYLRIKEVSQNRSIETVNENLLLSIKHFFKQLALPSAYKPIVILFVFFLIQQLSGTYVIIFYALSVFQELGGTFGHGLNEYGALVILGVIRFLISVIMTLCSKAYGRRVLSMTSGLGMSFSMFFAAMYIYLTSSVNDSEKVKEIMFDESQKWILLVIVLFYVCMSSIGFVIIPWTLIGEILPVSIRGVIGGIMVSVAYVMMFAVIKSYPYILSCMGAQGIFFFFSLMSIVGTCFIYLFLPETLGKSFLEIEKYFTGEVTPAGR